MGDSNKKRQQQTWDNYIENKIAYKTWEHNHMICLCVIAFGKRLGYTPGGNLRHKLHLFAEAIAHNVLHPTPTVSEWLKLPTNKEKVNGNHPNIEPNTVVE